MCSMGRIASRIASPIRSTRWVPTAGPRRWARPRSLQRIPNCVILRTSLVFSPFGRNTLTNLLKRAEQHDEMPVVADQHVNPTSAFDLAGGVLTVAANLVRAPRDSRAVRNVPSGGQRRRNAGGVRRSAFCILGGARRTVGARDPDSQ